MNTQIDPARDIRPTTTHTSLGIPRELTMTQKLLLSWQFAVKNGKHSYAGTVAPNVIARRRAKNRVAKASRKANR